MGRRDEPGGNYWASAQKAVAETGHQIVTVSSVIALYVSAADIVFGQCGSHHATRTLKICPSTVTHYSASKRCALADEGQNRTASSNHRPADTSDKDAKPTAASSTLDPGQEPPPWFSQSPRRASGSEMPS